MDWPVRNERLVKLWFKLRGVHEEDIEFERCVVRTPDVVADMFRPPIDCAFCRNVTSVHRVENILPEDFEELYAYSGHPVVVTDATRNWSALDTFSFEFFREIYSEDSAALKNAESKCQFFPYKTEFRRLGEVFQMDSTRARMAGEAKPWYIGW
nr:hypothetical protein BaRGS_004613 [Batillaria attramentaria]